MIREILLKSIIHSRQFDKEVLKTEEKLLVVLRVNTISQFILVLLFDAFIVVNILAPFPQK